MSLVEFLVIWLSFDIVVFATGWYAVKTIKPSFPNWWKRHIADYGPNFHSKRLPLSKRYKVTYRNGHI
ncbi:MAG: hypothetical protein KJ077_51655 [Anaerolineae bacterium]|nr:hypothetical protein [Anaerolineae bacterium]